MRRYRLQAVLESPLVVRRQRQSQRSEGVQFISGTLVRGAFARAYLDQYGEADETFQRLFVDENGCRFGPLDPAEHVLPLTAYSCKREPGFQTQERHGVVDLLAHLAGAALGGRPIRPGQCPRCGQELKQYSGFYDRGPQGPREPQRRWRRRPATHVGINRHTHTADESILFTLPALEPRLEPQGAQAALSGWVQAEEELAGRLRELLAAEDNILRVGHARTRGYGRVRMELQDGQAGGEESSDWQQRLDAWSKAMLARVPLSAGDRQRCFLFAMGLPTGAILLDELLRYTLDPSGMVGWLPPLAPPEPGVPCLQRPGKPFAGGQLWCVTAVAHHERLRGWNAAHGLPRHDEWQVARGSVYAYLYLGDPSGREELLASLRLLQAAGLGARRNEGYGQVVISDEFHTRCAYEADL